MNFVQAVKARMIRDAAVAAAPRRGAQPPITAHPLFVPVMAAWGALCGALCMLVLPASMIEALAAMGQPPLPTAIARVALAIGVGLALAAICHTGAAMLARRYHVQATRPRHESTVQPIDPARELGSASLDAPLPETDLRDLSKLTMAQDEEDASFPWPIAAQVAEELAEMARQPAPLPPPAPMPPITEPAPPIALDLGAFAELPGRNAVWVEGPVGRAAPVTQEPSHHAAIAQLRAVPPAELSLCQMVERFAFALQQYQAAQDAAGPDREAQERQQREAVLGEALKALAIVTHRGRGEANALQGVRRSA